MNKVIEMQGRAYGQMVEMWKRAVQVAQEGKKVLFCVHQRKMHLYLRDIPLDDKGTRVKDLAKQVGARGWQFKNGGKIYIHVPKQCLAGHYFDVVAIDNEALHHISLAEWRFSIKTRLMPDGYEL